MEQREELRKAIRETQRRQEALRRPEVNMAHLDSMLLQMNRMDLGMATPEDRRRLYTALGLQAHVDEERNVRLTGVFDPEVYLPGLMQDGPEWLAPRPETKGVVVTLDNTRHCIL